MINNLVGFKFNRLTVIKDSLKRSLSVAVLWECLCDCGNVCKVSGYNLKSGCVKSCGCIKKGKKPREIIKDNLSEYDAYNHIKQRCYNQNDKEYKNYGGRGIKMCNRWLESFENFFSDMGKKPSSKHSIDRFPNNDGDYELSNCRWATKIEQTLNRRCTVLVTHNGVTKNLYEWAKITGIKPNTLYFRIYRGRPLML